MDNLKAKLARVSLIEEIRQRPDVHLFIGPYIDGVEVTQAIQHYKADQHLTDPKDRGMDNSVSLVASKPAYVRVYVRSGLFASIANITGELRIERRRDVLGISWQSVATLSPQYPGQLTALAAIDYPTERSTLGATLNFIIPAADMLGNLRLTARIWRQTTPGTVAEETVMISATLLQTLRLRGIFISYNGDDGSGKNNITIAAPTLADLQNTAAWTLTVDPVQSTGSFVSAGTVAWTTPLTGVATQAGGCSTQWLALNAAVALVRTNDGNRNDVIYYGLLPAGVPIANVGGCESSGVSTGPNGAQVTMAHEVGHGAGLQHGPCGTTSGDPNYPAYEPYDAEPLVVPGPLGSTGTITLERRTARIGEYGLNINSGRIYPPATSDDYMSYCNQDWISLYHHEKLINNSKFDPKFVGQSEFRPPDLFDPWLWPWEYIPDPPAWEKNGWSWRQLKATPVISLIGMVTSEREIEVHSVMRVMALPRVENAVETDFAAELLDKNQKTIARAPLMQLQSQGGFGCGGGGSPQANGPYIFQALMADTPDGAVLRITRRGKKEEQPREVWVRRAPERPPRIAHFEVHAREAAGFARWEISDATSDTIECSMQFSKDRGKSWNGLAVGLTGTEHRFDLSALPSGEVIFAILVHDGFHTTRCVTEPIDLPARPPVIAIMHPHDGDTLFAGQPLRLWGSVSTGNACRIDDRGCRWMLDGHEVAHGVEAWITTPDKEGEHRCALIVDDEGHRAEATASFFVKGGHKTDPHDDCRC